MGITSEGMKADGRRRMERRPRMAMTHDERSSVPPGACSLSYAVGESEVVVIAPPADR